MRFTRITVDPAQLGGVPCIRGMRIPVATVLDMLADGMAEAEILEAYPDLEPADVQEALRYAAEAVRERALPLADELEQRREEIAGRGVTEVDVMNAIAWARHPGAADRLTMTQERLAADPIPPMSVDEVNAEIAAYRAEQRRAGDT